MPKLLDLYAGSGGCSVGYARAGFTVTGVDAKPQDDYPYELVVADALEVLADHEYLAGFDAIHASPPCQNYTRAAHLRNAQGKKPSVTRYDMPKVMEALRAWGGPYVVENVPGAPMTNPALLCGSAFGLRVRRHRLFDSNYLIMQPGCFHAAQGKPVGVYFAMNDQIPDGGTTARTLDEGLAAMGVDWVTSWRRLVEMVPPAYTEYLGQQLLAAVSAHA